MPNIDWLQTTLIKCDLIDFYDPLIEKLNITKPQHFNEVTKEDLQGIGISGPARKRLFRAVKETKAKHGAKGDFAPIIRGDENSGGGDLKSAQPVGGLIQDSELQILEKLGDGFSGIVFKAKWDKLGEGNFVAVKQLKQNATNPNEMREFLNEVNLMTSIHHKYLVRLFGVVLSDPIQMVTELAKNVCFREQLLASYPSLPTLHRFCLQLIQAMMYLQERRFIHRDIASRNVLIFDENTVKLGDFGLMCKLPVDSEVFIMTKRRKIPLAWSSPESLAKKEFSIKTDIFSFGVLLWEVFDRCRDPWPGNNGKQILEKLKNGGRLSLPRYANTEICKIVESCWLGDKNKRPDFVQLKSIFEKTLFEVIKARSEYKAVQSGQMLVIKKGDDIVVINKRMDAEDGNSLWYGQNLRTLEIGSFPKQCLQGGAIPDALKNLLTPQRPAPLRPSKDPAQSNEFEHGTRWDMKKVKTLPIDQRTVSKESFEKDSNDDHLYGDLDDIVDEFYDSCSEFGGTSDGLSRTASRDTSTKKVTNQHMAELNEKLKSGNLKKVLVTKQKK